ncbi:uracil-DNA glycosylase family protein [Alicyclobacillus kakegawensis]|uniref:uracil-DNA glycosylase family protein n=1 Tax=Alicyclobacillus kakegawensis TaxID=392012 RepID=UPI00082F8355|nr:uracil-DNA glycosylase family protein [Alicyclobacillus kakegawensis]
MNEADLDYREAFAAVRAELGKHYEVPDIVRPSSRFVFLLESPHVQELRYRAPVSGSSGATMSRHLFGERYARFPLGWLVKKNADEQKHRPSLDRIGLMNVSNIPMQASAYRNRDVHKRYGQWLQALEFVRANNHREQFDQPMAQAVQDVLVESLREKLHQLTARSCVFVPCGRFAQKFFRLAGVQSEHWLVIWDVPHPSYNSWDRARYQPAIERLREAWNRSAAYATAAAANDSPDSDARPV